MLALAVGAGIAGLTYVTAKTRRASTGSSVAAAAVTGAGSAIAVTLLASMWPIALAAGIGYLVARNMGGGPKALGPGSSD
ncbi:MAG: hypothetical protein R3A79_22160 [Nannocystaceae bacterium]